MRLKDRARLEISLHRATLPKPSGPPAAARLSGVTTINGELAETAENIFALRVQRVLFRTLGHAVRRTENTISCVRVYPVGKEPAMVALVLQHPNGAALLSVNGAHQAARFR